MDIKMQNFPLDYFDFYHKANHTQQLKNRRNSNKHVLKINIIIFIVINVLWLKSNLVNIFNKTCDISKIYLYHYAWMGFSMKTSLADIMPFLKLQISSWKPSANSSLKPRPIPPTIGTWCEMPCKLYLYLSKIFVHIKD